MCFLTWTPFILTAFFQSFNLAFSPMYMNFFGVTKLWSSSSMHSLCIPGQVNSSLCSLPLKFPQDTSSILASGSGTSFDSLRGEMMDLVKVSMSVIHLNLDFNGFGHKHYKNVTKWRAISLSKMDVSPCRDLHALLWRYPTLLGITRNHVGPREVTRVGERRKCQWCKHCRYTAEDYILRQI